MEKLIYIANIRLPTEKAHGIQIIKMCEAFAKEGYTVELVVPNRKSILKENIFHYYLINEHFKITKLWCLDLMNLGWIGFWIETFTFGVSSFFYTFGKSGVFYTRDEPIAVLMKISGKKIIWEAHMGHKNVFSWLALKLNIPIIVISSGLKNLYMNQGIRTDSVFIAPDAVDLKEFDINKSKEEVRSILNLPQNKKIVLYTGHLYSWKGVDTLAQAHYLLPPDTIMVFIGGTERDIKDFKKRNQEISSILILGNKPHFEVPMYLKAADVLVIPNTAKDTISRLYTSPMKLFEYMASHRPIIASDLPSIREILNDDTAYFSIPDDPISLGNVIKRVVESPKEAEAKALRAFEQVQGYSWTKRAHSILKFIG